MDTEYYKLYYNGAEGKRMVILHAVSGLKAFRNLHNFVVPIKPGTYWYSDLLHWLENEIEGKYLMPKDFERNMMKYSFKIKYTFICFEDEADAVAFKLRWS